MNLPPSVLLTVITATFLVGCEQEKTTSQKLDQLKAETKLVARELDDETFGKRAEFTARTKAQLDSLNADLVLLEARIAKASGDAKADSEAKIKALREKTAALGLQLDSMKDATESNWETVKSSTKKGLSELQDQFNLARQWMSEKIAP
jgi:BMFP domain-containing protein YqiC